MKANHGNSAPGSGEPATVGPRVVISEFRLHIRRFVF